MKAIIYLVLVGMIFTISCSSVKVHSDFDGSVDFTKFKTLEYMGWAEESDKILNQLQRDRIEKAFGKEFESRGYTGVEENGDIVVSLFIVVDQKTSVTAYTNHYGMGGYGYGAGWGWGYGGMGMSASTTTYSESDYLEGTLVLDVFDSKTKKLIWQSVGQKTIDENPKNSERNTAYVAEKMMKPYPVQPIKDK